jgi:uncharacterized protein
VARKLQCIYCSICSGRRVSAPRRRPSRVRRQPEDLLLAAPAGQRAVVGLDPGLRTGVKVAVVDRTGKLVATTQTIRQPTENQWDASLHSLHALCAKHGVELIAIGNGTASRETDKLAADLIKKHPELKCRDRGERGRRPFTPRFEPAAKIPVAGREPARRGVHCPALAGPLAELVKIEPKAIGVGQCQHDVNPHRMAKRSMTVEGV